MDNDALEFLKVFKQYLNGYFEEKEKTEDYFFIKDTLSKVSREAGYNISVTELYLLTDIFFIREEKRYIIEFGPNEYGSIMRQFGEDIMGTISTRADNVIIPNSYTIKQIMDVDPSVLKYIKEEGTSRGTL